MIVRLIRESIQEVLSDRPFHIHLFLEALYSFHIQMAFKITKHVTTLCVQPCIPLMTVPVTDCNEFDSDNIKLYLLAKAHVPALIVY